MRSSIGPRHQKIPFITGTVRSFPINYPMSFCYYRAYSNFCYFVLYPVNKPKPLSPCQHAKHTSHDEASPAPAVSAGQCSAQIRTWSQEKPSKSLSCIFLVSSWAWRRDWTTTSATGLTVRPAFGSAGRAGTNELVSLFFFFSFHLFASLHSFYMAADCQNSHSKISLVQLANQEKHFQSELVFYNNWLPLFCGEKRKHLLQAPFSNLRERNARSNLKPSYC